MMTTLTREEILEFFEEKHASGSCQSCGQNTWSVVGFEDKLPSIIMVRSDGAMEIPPQSIPAAVLVCTNCGYMRMHALGVIQHWKASKS